MSKIIIIVKSLKKMKMKFVALTTMIVLLISCQPQVDKKPEVMNENKLEGITITSKPFGKIGNEDVQLYTMTNKNGMKVSVTNYGGIITELIVPDRDGNMSDVTLGFNSLEDYQKEHPFFGALIGRYGNRIAEGKFSIGDKEYTLPINNDPNSLHGGTVGFDKRLWSIESTETADAKGVIIRGTSPDGDQGYPGNLSIRVTYLLNNKNELELAYQAKTDQTTVINLTNHAYFNLNGEGDDSILDHVLMIAADHINAVDETLIPTGELMAVKDSPFDFNTPTAIGDRINDEANVQIKRGGGYDHNYVLSDNGTNLKLIASAHAPSTGRYMEVYTTEPGVQMYSGNFLDGTLVGKSGKKYVHRSGFCLETQHFPDSPNQPDFPTTLLNPGEKYDTKTVYKFSTK